MVQRAACPVHLVGHSFGGLVSLAVALRRRVPLRSLVIIEAPAPGVLRCMGEDQHYLAFRNMTDAYFDAFQAGESSAIEAMIDFYGGAGTFASWPQRVRDYAVQTTAVNMLDWASAYDFQPTEAALATVRVPSLVVRGENSHPAVQRANELLAQCLPDASLATLTTASHFMIATHAEYVASLIVRRVRRTECVESIRMRAGQSASFGHEVHSRMI